MWVKSLRVSLPAPAWHQCHAASQPGGGGAAAAAFATPSNHAPHRVPAPWLHAQWRGKVEREEETTAWCPPRIPAGGRPSPVTGLRAARVRRLTPVVSPLCRSGPEPQPAAHVLYALSSNCAASRARGCAPAPHARERPLKRRGLSLALSRPGLAPVPGAAFSRARSRVASFEPKCPCASAVGEWRHRMTGGKSAVPPCPQTTAPARARR
jgi:hypothetical protein